MIEIFGGRKLVIMGFHGSLGGNVSYVINPAVLIQVRFRVLALTVFIQARVAKKARVTSSQGE